MEACDLVGKTVATVEEFGDYDHWYNYRLTFTDGTVVVFGTNQEYTVMDSE